MTDAALSLWAARLVEAGDLDASARLLDVGGGGGALARAIGQNCGAFCVVADTNAAPSPWAVPRVVARAEALPFRSEAFRAVLFSHVLHHVSSPTAAVREAARVLQPGGRLLVRTASHADLRALPEAAWMPHAIALALANTTDLPTVHQWAEAAGLQPDMETPCATPSPLSPEQWADSVADRAGREWALSGSRQPDPRSRARAWALGTFSQAPPVRETLLVYHKA